MMRVEAIFCCAMSCARPCFAPPVWSNYLFSLFVLLRDGERGRERERIFVIKVSDGFAAVMLYSRAI